MECIRTQFIDEISGLGVDNASGVVDGMMTAFERQNIKILPGSNLLNVRDKVEATVASLAKWGLTLDDYVKAAQDKPTLFYQNPERTLSNIETTVSLLSEWGLTGWDYVSAAVRQPQLFYQLPETIESNVRGTVQRLGDLKLTGPMFVAAAVKRPALFCMLPETLERHARLALRMQDRKLISPKYDVMETLLKSAVLTYGDDNFHLRYIFFRQQREKDMPFTAVFKPPRGTIEKSLTRHYGHDPDIKTVPSLFDDWREACLGAGDADHDRTRAHHRTLVALIRTGIIKSYKVS